MYEQLKKPKENKSRAAASSVAQKKNVVNHGLSFVDNRDNLIIQRVIPKIKIVKETTDSFSGRVKKPVGVKMNDDKDPSKYLDNTGSQEMQCWAKAAAILYNIHYSFGAPKSMKEILGILTQKGFNINTRSPQGIMEPLNILGLRASNENLVEMFVKPELLVGKVSSELQQGPLVIAMGGQKYNHFLVITGAKVTSKGPELRIFDGHENTPKWFPVEHDSVNNRFKNNKILVWRLYRYYIGYTTCLRTINIPRLLC